jgi:hypothetical protein
MFQASFLESGMHKEEHIPVGKEQSAVGVFWTTEHCKSRDL